MMNKYETQKQIIIEHTAKIYLMIVDRKHNDKGSRRQFLKKERRRKKNKEVMIDYYY